MKVCLQRVQLTALRDTVTRHLSWNLCQLRWNWEQTNQVSLIVSGNSQIWSKYWMLGTWDNWWKDWSWTWYWERRIYLKLQKKCERVRIPVITCEHLCIKDLSYFYSRITHLSRTYTHMANVTTFCDNCIYKFELWQVNLQHENKDAYIASMCLAPRKKTRILCLGLAHFSQCMCIVPLKNIKLLIYVLLCAQFYSTYFDI